MNSASTQDDVGNFITMSSKNIQNGPDLRGEYKGMSLKDIVNLYSKKSGDMNDFGIKGYSVPK